MAREVITEAIWSQLQPLLPKGKGRPSKNDRQFLEAVCWVVRTEAPWRDIPLEFGPWKTIYNRYNNWVKKGHLEAILDFFKTRWGSRMAYDRQHND